MALKILTIDDDPSVTKLISLMLRAYGMQAIPANTGKDGIQLVRAEAPDLVLLDMMLPEMSGLEICKEIRSFSNVPILGYSAMSDRQEIANALEAGFNDYLEKPSSGEVLVARIRQLTDSV
jgi:DNA-binding response OmpR family regulator